MQELIQKATVAIVNPIIQVMFAAALLTFMYGIFEFVRGAEKPEVRIKGQQHMIWGIFGLFIMITVFTLIKILLHTIGAPVPGILK